MTRSETATDHNTDYSVYASADDCGHPNPDDNPEFSCKHNDDCCGQLVECRTRVEFDKAMADWEDNHTSGTGVDGDSVTICHLTPMGTYCEECSEENGDWINHRPICLDCEYWLEDDGSCQCEPEVFPVTAPDPRLDEIQARLSAATPGPWEAAHRPVLPNENDPDILAAKRDEMGGEPGSSIWARERQTWGSLWPSRNGRSDAEFIAHAPSDVAFLLAELRKAREALERVEKLHKREVIAVHEGYGEEAICTECGHRWPCDTRAAVAAAKGDERG